MVYPYALNAVVICMTSDVKTVDANDLTIVIVFDFCAWDRAGKARGTLDFCE